MAKMTDDEVDGGEDEMFGGGEEEATEQQRPLPDSVEINGQTINISKLNPHELFLYQMITQNMPSSKHNRYMYEKGCALFAPEFGLEAPVPPDLDDVRMDFFHKYDALPALAAEMMMIRDDNSGSVLAYANYIYDRELKKCWNDIMRRLKKGGTLAQSPTAMTDHMVAVLTAGGGVRKPFQTRGGGGGPGTL
jgi:hypothetical protein